jgi:hypothetical protein
MLLAEAAAADGSIPRGVFAESTAGQSAAITALTLAPPTRTT